LFIRFSAILNENNTKEPEDKACDRVKNGVYLA
jgi:hypothetical protein